MTRIPLLTGTRIAVVDVPDDTIVLTPPPPARGIANVEAAVRDALRFPLAGEPLEALATRGGRATIVVEPPALPIPGSNHDPRQAAISAASAELVRSGVPSKRQTLLVAGGLARRSGSHELEALVSPDFARRFHGRVVVHDAEADDLVLVGSSGDVPLRVNRAVAETDLVLTVTAAETVLHGGPAALLAAGGAEALRAAGATSLVETRGSAGWRLAVELERLLASRLPVIGASLALEHPRLSGTLSGFPFEQGARDYVASSPLRRLFTLLPGAVRARVFHALGAEIAASAAFAGPPSVAHAEALLRAVETRATTLSAPVDALFVGVPRVTPYLPRERPNPLLAAFLGLGLALRLWRDAFPVADGGTVVLVHRFHRYFAHPTQQPYRAFFAAASRIGREPEELRPAEDDAATEPRAIETYRSGRSCHPRLPFADWDACMPALARLGSVVVAGCRDGVAARALGFVPAHGIGPALEMARGRAGDAPRIAFLLSPPYFPLRVGSAPE